MVFVVEEDEIKNKEEGQEAENTQAISLHQ